MKLEIVKQTVESRCRKLDREWTLEPMQNVKAYPPNPGLDEFINRVKASEAHERARKRVTITHFADTSQDGEYGDSFIPLCTGRALKFQNASYIRSKVNCKRCLAKIKCGF